MIELARARAAQLSAALLGVLALVLTPAPGLAAQPDRVVAVGDGEALVIPAASPLELSGVGLDTAAFSGRLLVTGIFTYEGCGRAKCDGQPLDDGDLELRIVPDPAVAAGLPHWKARRNKVAITLDNPEDFLRSVITPEQRAALRSGKLPRVTGRVAIVVDRFRTEIECDSVNDYARFVDFAKPATIEPLRVAGHFGCG